MAQSQGMTPDQQLAKLKRLAEIVGAMVLEVPPGHPCSQAYVSRRRIDELEEALIAAGYDMPAIRECYKMLKKEVMKKEV